MEVLILLFYLSVFCLLFMIAAGLNYILEKISPRYKAWTDKQINL